MKAPQNLSPLYPIGFNQFTDKSTPVALTICHTAIGDRLPRGKKFRKAQQLMDSMRYLLIGSHPQALHYYEDCFEHFIALIGGTSCYTIDEEERKYDLDNFSEHIPTDKNGNPEFNPFSCAYFLMDRFNMCRCEALTYSLLRGLVMK